MTDLINDTAEHHLVGEGQTVILRHDVGEATQNLGPYSEYTRPVRRPDAVDRTGEIPRFVEPTLGLPRTGAELVVAHPLAWPMERIADPADTQVQTLMQSIDPDGEAPDGYEARHRDPKGRTAIPGEGRWGWLSEGVKPVVAAVKDETVPSRLWMVIAIGTAFIIWSGVTLAVIL